MKFKLNVGQSLYYKDEIEEIERFRKLEFVVEDAQPLFSHKPPLVRIKGEPEIQFGTLEELMFFVKEWGGIILDEDLIILNPEF
jgi:hypothetical protein